MKIPELKIPRYLRKGQCNRCGWCCEYKGCEYLSFNGNNIAVCAIYKDRGKKGFAECVRFPQAPPILTEKCGYYFLDTWEDNKKVKFGKDL